MKTFAFRTVAWLLFAALAWTTKGEESTQPGKGGYTLFNPTPRTLMRDWHTDHAGLSPYTVDAGHFEADLLALSYATLELDDSVSGTPFTLSRETWVFGTVRLKAGLANNLDLEVTTPGYLTDKVEGEVGGLPPFQDTINGFTDVSARLKVNLWGNDAGTTALALSGGVRFPTATDDLAHDEYAGGPGLEFAAKLPFEFEMRINCISTLFVVSQSPSFDDEIQASVQNLISLSHGLVGDLEGYAIFSTVVSTRPRDDWSGDIRIGLNYRLTPCIEVYAGSGFGVQGMAADYNPFLGIAARF